MQSGNQRLQLQQAVRRQPADFIAWVMLADAELEAGDRSAGEQAARRALQLRPGHLKPELPRNGEPRTGLSMGEHCERMALAWQIGRAEQDELALLSHQHLAAAYAEGWQDDLLTPFLGLTRDNNLRSDLTLEQLSKLKPAFDRSGLGTLTAGNSTPLTDGASLVLLGTEEWAQAQGLPVLAMCKATAVAVQAESAAAALAPGGNVWQGAVTRATRGGTVQELAVRLQSGVQLVGFSREATSLRARSAVQVTVEPSAVVIALSGE